MPENLSVPMPGKDRGEENRRGSVSPGQDAASPATSDTHQVQAEAARHKASELLATLPDQASNWPATSRRQLGPRLGDLAGALRLLGCHQDLWKPVLALATSLGRLTPDGAFPPMPRGPLLARIKKVLTNLADVDGPLTTMAATRLSPLEEPREKPDVPYTKMLLKKLGSD